MATPRKNIIGKTFGRWAVLADAPQRDKNLMYACRCACGTERAVLGFQLRNGRSKSCGCLARELTSARDSIPPSFFVHGESSPATPEYTTWRNMIKRCHFPKDRRYKNYGARGIEVCAQWRGSKGFEAFLLGMGRRPSALHSIERKDNDGPYSKDNCRWATRAEQNRNRRANHWITANGETLTITDWANRLGVRQDVIQHRLKSGWREVDAVSISKVPKHLTRQYSKGVFRPK